LLSSPLGCSSNTVAEGVGGQSTTASTTTTSSGTTSTPTGSTTTPSGVAGGGASGSGGAGGAAAAVVADFSLQDVNASSPTFGTPVSPRDYLQQVSGWFFGEST
jgi:hypothetical protein